MEAFAKFDDLCLIKSFDECIGSSELKCYDDFPTTEGCVGPGVRLAIKSTIRLPTKSF